LTKESATQILEVFRDRLKLDLDALVESGTEWIKDGDFIVIHSIEENIEHLIPSAKKKGIKFKILLLQQDIVTTEQILIILNENQIDFEVIPEYDLVHYVDKITKLFLGTQSLTNDDYLICDPGTSNIVSECHIYNIPVLLFLKIITLLTGNRSLGYLSAFLIPIFFQFRFWHDPIIGFTFLLPMMCMLLFASIIFSLLS